MYEWEFHISQWMNNTMRWDWVWDNKENEMRKKTSSQFQISSCATLHFSFIFISFSLPFPLFTSIITQNIYRFLREKSSLSGNYFSFSCMMIIISHLYHMERNFVYSLTFWKYLTTFFLKKRSMEARMMITSIIYLCALL